MKEKKKRESIPEKKGLLEMKEIEENLNDRINLERKDIRKTKA